MATYRIKSADGSKTYNITLPDPKPGEAPPQQPYSGTILPFSKDAQGNVSFDSDAGLLGVVKRAVTFPADAMRGKVDPLSDEGIARAVEMGTVVTPMSPAARSGVGFMGVPAKRSPVKPAVPSTTELKGAADFGFDLARQLDVRYDPRAVQGMIRGVMADLHAAGFRKINAPKSFAELAGLTKPAAPGSYASIDDLHAVRKALNRAARDFNNPEEQEAASRIIAAIDRFITEPDPAAVVAGPASAAGNIWKDAIGNYAAGKRSERVMGIEESTIRRAKTANSGFNVDNTIRQRVASVLDDPKKRAGFSPEEIALLEKVAEGTAPRNVSRAVGNYLFGPGGLAATVAGGATSMASGSLTGALIGAGITATGLATKLAGNKATKNALRKVDNAVRRRSPVFRERSASPEVAPMNPAVRGAPSRAATEVIINGGAAPPNSSPIDPRILSIINAINRPPMTEEQMREYYEQKWAPQQGG